MIVIELIKRLYDLPGDMRVIDLDGLDIADVTICDEEQVVCIEASSEYDYDDGEEN